MRKELEIIKVIEQYLLGELNTEEIQRFESQLSKSPELQKRLEKQRLVMEGVKNVAIKGKVKKAKRSFNFLKIFVSVPKRTGYPELKKTVVN